MDVTQRILSDLTVFSKYAKYDEKLGRRETWEEIVGRTESMHMKKFPQLEKEIRAAFDLVRQKKVLPSMRSLQFAGKPIAVNNSRVFNCAYMPASELEVFNEAMFLLLSGCGVGFSVQHHHVDKLPVMKYPKGRRKWVVEDSIIGWADAVKILVKAYAKGKSMPIFDFSEIREKGAPLITAGGKAPGPQPLKDCLHNLQKVLDEVVGLEEGRLRPIHVHDMMCHIADAVLSGGIRRSAMISLFSPDDGEMLSCKAGAWWEAHPHRGRSNNSAVLDRNVVTKEEFMSVWSKVRASGSGEPGFYFTNDRDLGTNPC
jgi:ribonucleoside-triphosphate reductase